MESAHTEDKRIVGSPLIAKPEVTYLFLILLVALGFGLSSVSSVSSRSKICLCALCDLAVLNPIGKQAVITHPLLRFVAVLACLSLFGPPWTSAATKPDQPDKPNFNGTWTLDLRASTSLEPLLKEVGASILEQKFVAWVNLTATFHQTGDVLMVATRGPGFALDETLYLDGRRDPSSLQLLGATSLNTRTVWSNDNKQLVATHQIKTKEGKEGQLIVTRYLIGDGGTLMVAFTLKLNAEPDEISARQTWHKQTQATASRFSDELGQVCPWLVLTPPRLAGDRSETASRGSWHNYLLDRCDFADIRVPRSDIGILPSIQCAEPPPVVRPAQWEPVI